MDSFLAFYLHNLNRCVFSASLNLNGEQILWLRVPIIFEHCCRGSRHRCTPVITCSFCVLQIYLLPMQSKEMQTHTRRAQRVCFFGRRRRHSHAISSRQLTLRLLGLVNFSGAPLHTV